MAQAIPEKLALAYERFSKLPALAHGLSSITVVHAQTGEVLFTANGDLGLATASTLKIVTAATAYQLLGPDFRYKTQLLYAGNIDAQGTLNGYIILKGSGDPTLGSDRYEKARPDALLASWVSAIKTAGIRAVSGTVLADDRLFGGQQTPPRWVWQDMGSYYGAGLSALNWMENKAQLRFQAADRVGAGTQLLSTKPDLPYLQFANNVLTGERGSGDKVYPYAAPYASLVTLTGTYGIDLKKGIEMALPDAAYDVAWRLKQALERAGIKVSDAPATAMEWEQSQKNVPGRTRLLHEHVSPPLREIVYWFNQKSINLYGEALLKTVAHIQGKPTETLDAAQFMANYWCERVRSPRQAMKIYDGSGLSPENRVSTKTMAAILASVKKEKWFDGYFDSFPIYNGLRMKSGTIDGVMGYTGYHTNAQNVPMVFSVMVNNYAGSSQAMRQQLFKLLDALK